MTTYWSESTLPSWTIWWTGLAPWKLELPFPGSFTLIFPLWIKTLSIDLEVLDPQQCGKGSLESTFLGAVPYPWGLEAHASTVQEGLM